MGNSRRQDSAQRQESGQDRQSSDDTGSGMDVRDTAVIAVLSLAAMVPVYRLDPSLQYLFGDGIVAFLRSLLPVLLALPLPAAYIAIISKKRFRKEIVGTLVTVPLALLGTRFAVFAAGVVLGSVLVSYKSKSLYNGRNTNWVHFKAAGSMVLLLAIAAGLATASLYSGTPAFREDIRGNITEESVDVALEYADTAGIGGGQEQAADQQLQQMTGMIGPLTANLSTVSIRSTEAVVFQAVQKTREQDSSKFDADERTILRTAFETAENQVPSQIRDQAETMIQEQFQGLDAGAEDIEEEALKQMVTPRVRRVVNELITDSPGMVAAAFIGAFSVVMLFKLPFKFLSVLYAAILARLRRVL